MRRFDTADVVSETDDEYIYGNSWGSNTNDIENSFRYMNYGKYLYGVRNTPAGEQRLNKRLGTLGEGENLEMEFDYYINAPYVWFDSMGYFDIRLENADKSIVRSLVKFEYSRKDYGFRVNFLGNSENSYQLTEIVDWGDESRYNKNNLHIKCSIKENEEDGYDAFMNIRNANGIETDVQLKDILTKEEFVKINTFVIANQTISQGTRYGETIAGIKNILVTKMGNNLYESDQITKFQDGEFGGIQFSNLTQKPFDATILLGGYRNGQLVSASTYNFESRDEKSGFLSIPVHKTEANEEKFKVFLIEDTESMRPFKTVDEIEVLN